MKNIENFINRLMNVNKNFQIKDYDYEKYDCEISDFFKMSLEVREYKLDFSELLKYWRNIFLKDYFELHHPIYNNIKTRAIKNFFAPKKHPRFSNYVFFIDENNQNPWILCQVYDFFQFLITEEGIFSNPISNKIMANEAMRDIERLPLAIEDFLSSEELFYKDIKFGWLLRKNRPAHHFYEDISSYYILDIKKPIYSKQSFFVPTNSVLSSKENRVFIYPGIFRSLGRISDTLYYQSNHKVFLEAIGNFKKTNKEIALTLWLQLPGERRVWLECMAGVKNILCEIKNYFKDIIIYFDGMTSYENEVNNFDDNHHLYSKIKSTVLDDKIEIISMIGKDYRTKIFYCSQVDLALCEMGTALLVPHSFCNKEIVSYYGYKEYKNAGYDNPNKIRRVLDRYIKVVDFKDKFIFNYHIPWQHIYNLTAEVLEELSAAGKLKIKNLKMHRLEVPPVELVAKQYELEQKLGIKLPIESCALYTELEKQINTLALNNNTFSDQLIKNIEAMKHESFSTFQTFLDQEKQKLQLQQRLEQDFNNQLKIKNAWIDENNNLIKEKDCFINQLIFEKKYKTAKERIQNHLAYKLGTALIENSKSIFGYIRMPFVLSYIRDKHKLEQKKYEENIKKYPELILPPLESYADYEEALKEKECFTYKLGLALMRADREWYKGGYIRFYFESRRMKKEFLKRKGI